MKTLSRNGKSSAFNPGGVKQGIIARFRGRLPVQDKTPIVTLLEGDTPLIPADRLARHAGLPEGVLYLKVEGANPTGSFKDRGMTVAMSKALEMGARTVICASTGNTAASAAAYAARGGLRCIVVLPAGAVALGKLAQALTHGAEVIAVRGGFDEALELVREASSRLGLTVVNSLNPNRLEGQKTAAFEIVERIGYPTFQFMPVGNAGNITSYWKGYKEWAGKFRVALPRMMGFQAKGAAPLVTGKPVSNPKTVATAIRIGNPVSWQGAIAARDESKGQIGAVTDNEILEAYALVSRIEGVFCEPSSAAGIAGLLKLGKKGFFEDSLRRMKAEELKVVCVLTGHGLKDPERPLKMRFKWRTIPPALKALEKLL